MSFTAPHSRTIRIVSFKFLVKWNGCRRHGGPQGQQHHQVDRSDRLAHGGDSNFSAKVPGLTKWEPITLERGLSADTAFQDWMIQVKQVHGGRRQVRRAVPRVPQRISISRCTACRMILVMTINVYNAWPSKLTIADFDAKATELAIEHMELQNEAGTLTPGAQLARRAACESNQRRMPLRPTTP